tara:strand:- start:1184 stop:1552 length:369 start_codon:yes stop_codon:yes gene_type:complete
MTVSVSTASNPVVKNVVVDLDANLVVETAATAAQYVYAVEITNGSAEAVYLHMIKATQGSNTGTAHTTQLYCAGNTSCYYYFPMKYAHPTGIQFYASQAAGGGANAEAPTGTVSVKFGLTAQ